MSKEQFTKIEAQHNHADSILTGRGEPFNFARDAFEPAHQARAWLITELHTKNAMIKKLISALETIGSVGKDGICLYGCDCPHVAISALTDHGNAEYAANQS